MPKKLFYLLVIFNTFYTLNANAGGAEGHGGGGDLASAFKQGKAQLESTLAHLDEIPEYLWTHIKPEVRSRLKQLAPAILRDSQGLQITWLSVAEESRLSESNKKCITNPLTLSNSLALSPVHCRKTAALINAAAGTLLQTLLIRQGLEESEIRFLNPYLTKLIDVSQPFFRPPENERDKKTMNRTDEILADLERSLNIKTAESTPEGYRVELEEARRKAVKAIWDRFPRQKPSWMDNGLWNWLVDYGERLVREVESSRFEIYRATDRAVAGQETCARTQLTSLAIIVFNFDVCYQTVRTRRQYMHTVVHESVHHLGIADEASADRIADAVTHIHEDYGR